MLAFFFFLTYLSVLGSDDAGPRSDDAGPKLMDQESRKEERMEHHSSGLGSDDAGPRSDDAGPKLIPQESRKEERMEHHPSGLQYRVLRKGSGKFHPVPDAPCECHYSVTLKDGTEIDSSYSRGEPKTFAPNEVIEGWETAMQLMVEGDKWYVVIPTSLAYGREGSPPNIPANAELILTIELIKIIGEKVLAFKCDVFTKEDCGERETKWLNKIEEKFGKNHTEYVLEHVKLSKIKQGKKLKPKIKKWLGTRLKLLRQFLENLTPEPRPPVTPQQGGPVADMEESSDIETDLDTEEPIDLDEEMLKNEPVTSKEGQQEGPVVEKEEPSDEESVLDTEEPIVPNEEMLENEPVTSKEEL